MLKNEPNKFHRLKRAASQATEHVFLYLHPCTGDFGGATNSVLSTVLNDV